MEVPLYIYIYVCVAVADLYFAESNWYINAGCFAKYVEYY